MPTTCDHKACRSVTLTRDELIVTERPMLFLQPDGKPNTWLEVTAADDGRFLGGIYDQGYRRHESLGGDWVSRYLVIAGGSAVLLEATAWVDGEWVRTEQSIEAVLQQFARWCQRVSFAHRMALHG